MSSVEQKINIFRFELEQRVESERLERIEQAQEESKEELQNSNILIERQKDQIEERFKRLEQRNVNKILAEGKNKAQDLILKARREVSEDFQKSVVEAAKELLNYEQYTDYLLRCLKDIKEFFPVPQEVIIYANKADHKKLKDIVDRDLSDYTITFRELPTREIGGLMVRDKDERVNYDYSIRNLLSENEQKIDSALRDAMIGA